MVFSKKSKCLCSHHIAYPCVLGESLDDPHVQIKFMCCLPILVKTKVQSDTFEDKTLRILETRSGPYSGESILATGFNCF
jgi:hypothetical protein